MRYLSRRLEAFTARKKGRKPADVKGIFERIYRGSMPAVVSNEDSSSQIFYSSYLSAYIERDVRELSNAIDSLKFLHFITAVVCMKPDLGAIDRKHYVIPVWLI